MHPEIAETVRILALFDKSRLQEIEAEIQNLGPAVEAASSIANAASADVLALGRYPSGLIDLCDAVEQMNELLKIAIARIRVARGSKNATDLRIEAASIQYRRDPVKLFAAAVDQTSRCTVRAGLGPIANRPSENAPESPLAVNEIGPVDRRTEESRRRSADAFA